MPLHSAVAYGEEEHKFKMWYSAGGGKLLGLVTCYAESSDGKVWIKPELDVVPGTNIVDTLEHDCVSVCCLINLRKTGRSVIKCLL